MNTFLLEASRWLWDYFTLATVLLGVVLVFGKLLTQPARRMAVHWSGATGLLLLALLCAVPGWSVVYMLPSSPETPPAWVENLEPTAGPAIQIANVPSQPMSEMPQSVPSTSNVTTNSTATKITVVDYGVLSFYTIAAGTLVVLLWLAVGTWQVRRLRRQAQTAPSELVALLAKLSIDKPIPALGIVAKLPVAAAVGLLSPMVLLPKSFLEQSSSDKLQSVLAHELAHIRHRDLWLLALMRGLLLVLWAHPLYWLWRRGVRLDQETLADVAAAEVTSRTDYAEQLVVMARETASVSRWLPVASSIGLWENASQLKRRVAVLLDERLTVVRACSRRWRVGSALGMLIIAGGLSLITLSPAEPQMALAESKEAKPVEEKTPISPSLDLHIATPPADSSEESSSSKAVSKSTKNSPAPLNDTQILLQKQYKRLHKLRKPNTIIGICIDEKGRPLAGVQVQVYVRQLVSTENNPDPILETKSDDQGEFLFSDVVDVAKEFPNGLPEEHFQGSKIKILNIQGQLEGRVPGIGGNTLLEIVRRGSTLAWVMSPAQELHGRVTDNEGQPVVGAKVAVGYYATQGGAHGINTAITDTNGEYVIDDLPSEDLFGGNQAFFVKHPKYAARRARMVKIPGKLDVQLVPGSVIEGSVTLREGAAFTKPMAGSIVRLQRVLPQPKSGERPDAYSYSYQVENATVNKMGHYRFESLPAGKYHLTADVEGWVTQGAENIEVAAGETATAPDISLTRGGRVRVQLVDEKTGEPMRFEAPTKGYINPRLQPQRAAIFMFRNNIVKFSADGIGEISLPAGKYSFLVSIPLADGGDWISVVPDDLDAWPTYEVVDGERLEISTHLRVQKRPAVADGIFTLSIAVPPASDEESEEETPEGTFDVPATQAAESTDQEKNLNSIFDERTNQKGGRVK